MWQFWQELTQLQNEEVTWQLKKHILITDITHTENKALSCEPYNIHPSVNSLLCASVQENTYTWARRLNQFSLPTKNSCLKMWHAHNMGIHLSGPWSPIPLAHCSPKWCTPSPLPAGGQQDLLQHQSSAATVRCHRLNSGGIKGRSHPHGHPGTVYKHSQKWTDSSFSDLNASWHQNSCHPVGNCRHCCFSQNIKNTAHNCRHN